MIASSEGLRERDSHEMLLAIEMMFCCFFSFSFDRALTCCHLVDLVAYPDMSYMIFVSERQSTGLHKVYKDFDLHHQPLYFPQNLTSQLS